MHAKPNILLAEDEAALREGLALLLTGEGYAVRAAKDGREALDFFQAQRPDLVLLDVMMPQLNGYAVCREIRRSDTRVPIVFLTVAAGEVNEIRGLALGADDYIAKTAPQAVLLARIAAALARAQRVGDPAQGDFTIGTSRVDTTRFCIVSPAGVGADVSLREVEVLRFLAQHPNEVIFRDVLLTRFWGADFTGNEAALTTAIRRLREKLGKDGNLIQTVYGTGYRLIRETK